MCHSTASTGAPAPAQSRGPRNELVHPDTLAEGIPAARKSLTKRSLTMATRCAARAIVGGQGTTLHDTDPEGLEVPRRDHLDAALGRSEARPRAADDAELPENPVLASGTPGALTLAWSTPGTDWNRSSTCR